MGIASLLVLMSHFIIFPDNKYISVLQSHGIIGVDIFLFLSGFGLCSSLQRNDNILTFYRKRLIRIFSVFLPLSLIYVFLTFENVEGAVLNMTTLGYWVGHDYLEWYTPAILFLYVLFPCFYKLCDKAKPLQSGLYVSTIFYYGVVFLFCKQIGQEYLFFIYRIPIFLIGCFSYLCMNYIELKWILLFFILGTVLTVGTQLLGMYSQSSWILSSALCTLGVMACSVLLLSRNMRINVLFKRIGNMSYELFLIQIIFLRLHISKYVSVKTMILLIILSAFFIHLLIGYVRSKLSTSLVR